MTTATFFIGAKIIKRQQTTDNRQQIFLLAKKSETPIAESLKKYKIKYVVLRKITFVFLFRIVVIVLGFAAVVEVRVYTAIIIVEIFISVVSS